MFPPFKNSFQNIPARYFSSALQHFQSFFERHAFHQFLSDIIVVIPDSGLSGHIVVIEGGICALRNNDGTASFKGGFYSGVNTVVGLRAYDHQPSVFLLFHVFPELSAAETAVDGLYKYFFALQGFYLLYDVESVYPLGQAASGTGIMLNEDYFGTALIYYTVSYWIPK